MFGYLSKYDLLKLVDIIYYVKMLLRYNDISFLTATANPYSMSNYKIALKVVNEIKASNAKSGTDMTQKHLDELDRLVMEKMSQRNVNQPKVDKLIKELTKRAVYRPSAAYAKRKKLKATVKKASSVNSVKQRYVLSHK